MNDPQFTCGVAIVQPPFEYASTERRVPCVPRQVRDY